MCNFWMKLNAVNLFLLFSMIVSLESFVKAIALKFFGNFTTASSWLIQTDVFELKKFFVSREFFFLKINARPNSLRFFDDLIFPPFSFAIN